ncbi:hypothetical protein D6D20_08227 [Aureobasidium pullulans]|uniref:Mei2-like C-terminal RNA recognition motif domain-containing protein n=1 Tax=Aureobasidium pullulans TaxID=5580 RepID=A0A4S8YW81_AURPU|nr:hypothetical protein D6D20_08227 [Aureobasidium pullulans]
MSEGCALCGLFKCFGVYCADTRGTDFLLAEFRNSVIMGDVLVTLRLDKSSFGHYDFSYLRIDLSTELNVGYAFVNFTHPEHLTNFVNAKVGKPWSLYGSTKRCEVSYATSQGIDCLLAKVRNRLAALSAADFGTLRRDSVVPTVRLLLFQRHTTLDFRTLRRDSRVQPDLCFSLSGSPLPIFARCAVTRVFRRFVCFSLLAAYYRGPLRAAP